MNLVLVAALVVAGIAAGPILTGLDRPARRHLVGWLLVAVLLVTADRLLGSQGAVVRMIGLCCVLLGAMKGLVYAEWQGRLPLARYLVFAFLWFGMDPASFRHRRRGLTWRGDLALGVGMMLLGTAGAWVVAEAGWRQVLVMFVPMSLGFHFGALRVLKGGLRRAGFPVRTLFPNVLEARGIADFWSRRWNVGYSQMMQRLVGRPVGRLAGETAGVMAVFLGSGLLHEVAITLPVRAGFGGPTLYFAAHGLLTVVEKRFGKPLGRIPALLLVALPLGLLFPPAFQEQVIERCLAVFERGSGSG